VNRNSHIINAASNLLGIALLIVAGIHIAGRAEKNIADEIAWIAAVLLSISCTLAYFSIRRDPVIKALEDWADRVFVVGMLVLVGAVSVLAFYSF